MNPSPERQQTGALRVGAILRFGAVLILALGSSTGWAASFLFDASHSETAGNADWVIDQDASPQRFPTPDQATVTGSTGETFWTGAISAWGIDLVKRGHHVETLPNGITITYGSAGAQDLSNYQVFVVDEPNRVFNAAEKTAIVNFVKNGGGLFMVANHGDSDRNGDGKDSVDVWNDLFANNTVQKAPFGVVFNGDKVSPSNESVDATVSNPITHGPAGTVTQFNYVEGSLLTIDITKNASVRGAVWRNSTRGSDAVMVAYGTFGSGKFVALGDSSPTDDGTGAPGNTLFNGWDSASGDNGQLIINASIWLATPLVTVPPPNDNLASAAALTGPTPSGTGTNVNGTKESGEPNHAGNAGGKSVWWKWTAPSSGNLVIDTNGSNFDTLLGVYTGTAVNALTTVASNNNNGASTTSRVAFAVTAGVTYHIAVDGLDGLSGNIALSLVLTIPPPPGPGTIASWNFDAVPYPTPIPSSTGISSIDLTGWGGTFDNFNGDGDSPDQALALVGTGGNGTYIEIPFSMTGYSALKVTFATRGTTTGYTSGLWSWSVNGGAFTTLPGVNTATISTNWSNKMVDFTAQTGLNNANSVRLRYTLDGSSGTAPNNRIDDLVIMATQTSTVNAVINTTDAYEHGSQPVTITVSSSFSAGAGGLPVHYQLSGTATAPGSAGNDYTVSGNSASGVVTIPAGATSAVLTFTPVTDSNPTEFDENVIFTLQPGSGYFVGGSNTASITIHDDTPYSQAWANQFPSFTGAAASPTSDIEKDGLTNLLEFAFNGNPFQSDPGMLPLIGQMQFPDPDEGNVLKNYPVISFHRRTDAPNLTYAIEISNDLVNWTNNVEEVSATPTADPNVQDVVYRGLQPISGNGSVSPVFLHVVVTNGAE